MLFITPKSTILHRKAPSKLSLKKNIRRSSILDKKAISFKNDSLIDKSTSSGTISLFSSSDSDIFEENKASADSGGDVQVSTTKRDNLSFTSSNLHNEEQKSHINTTKNESVILISPSTSENESLLIIDATLSDNSRNSLFSSFSGKMLEICNDDRQVKRSTIQNIAGCKNNLGGILNNESEIKFPHITIFEKEKNEINIERKEVNNSPVLVNDLYDQPDRNQHIEILDKLYGAEWRKAEKLVFSEPRLAKTSKTKIKACKTDIKPFKSVRNYCPKGKKKARKSPSPCKKKLENFYDSDTSDGNSEQEIKTARTLFPKVIRKPVKSPWVKILQNVCDSDTDEGGSEKENKNAYQVSSKIRNKLNYDSSSTITSDNSDLESSFVTFTDESCNSNSFSDTNRKKVKTKRIKKSGKHEKSDEEEEIEDEKGATRNIFLNNKFVFSTPQVNKRDKLTSAIKSVPSLNTSEIIHKSFLESLSVAVPLNQCDPSARIFRNSYQTFKMQLTEKLFKLFNEKIFNNLIPEDASIFWNVNLTKTAGYCSYGRVKGSEEAGKKIKISLSVKVLDSAERLRCTLVHEMIHAACMISGKHDHHGPNFKAWARKAIEVFPELPPITRCHSYPIKAKYTYKCLSCGLCKNRHSKSIDITKKVCGRCHGKFELLINKIAKGEKKSVPVTPKTPSGFALFVKNNYAQCRTPELKHGEVMKLLGSKFNDLKLSVGK